MTVSRTNLCGAITANVINAAAILIFIARLSGWPEIGHWIGIAVQLSIVPLLWLLYSARHFDRPRIYYVWIGLMIAFIIVEFLFDWYPRVDFRDNLSLVIPYVMLFFGATGGMIGVASLAGRKWMIVTSISFLAMFVLAFVQRQVTGM